MSIQSAHTLTYSLLGTKSSAARGKATFYIFLYTSTPSLKSRHIFLHTQMASFWVVEKRACKAGAQKSPWGNVTQGSSGHRNGPWEAGRVIYDTEQTTNIEGSRITGPGVPYSGRRFGQFQGPWLTESRNYYNIFWGGGSQWGILSGSSPKHHHNTRQEHDHPSYVVVTFWSSAIAITFSSVLRSVGKRESRSWDFPHRNKKWKILWCRLQRTSMCRVITFFEVCIQMKARLFPLLSTLNHSQPIDTTASTGHYITKPTIIDTSMRKQ